jgi:hypothetical protein
MSGFLLDSSSNLADGNPDRIYHVRTFDFEKSPSKAGLIAATDLQAPRRISSSNQEPSRELDRIARV